MNFSTLNIEERDYNVDYFKTRDPAPVADFLKNKLSELAQEFTNTGNARQMAELKARIAHSIKNANTFLLAHATFTPQLQESIQKCVQRVDTLAKQVILQAEIEREQQDPQSIKVNNITDSVRDLIPKPFIEKIISSSVEEGKKVLQELPPDSKRMLSDIAKLYKGANDSDKEMLAIAIFLGVAHPKAVGLLNQVFQQPSFLFAAPPPQVEPTALEAAQTYLGGWFSYFGTSEAKPKELDAKTSRELVNNLFNTLKAHYIDSEGIFRLSGNETKLKEYDTLPQDKKNEWPGLKEPNDLATLIKRQTAKYPGHVIPDAFIAPFLEAAPVLQKNPAALGKVLSGLPPENRTFLREIILHLHEITQHPHNKMGPESLATCFAVNLCKLPESDPATMFASNMALNGLIALLIKDPSLIPQD